MNNLHRKLRGNKIKGALFGLACGDALGATLEFLPKDQWKKVNGKPLKDIIGQGPFKLKPGQTTDDTQMMLCVARGILKDTGSPTHDIGREFIRWYESKPFDIGITCRSTIALKVDNVMNTWYQCSEASHNYCGGKSAGNGTLMRCLPIGLAYRKKTNRTLVSKLQSKLTHWDDMASDACIMYNNMIHDILGGKRNKAKLISKNEISPDSPYSLETIENLTYEDLKPTGFVIDTLQCVLWFFLNTDSLEDCIIQSANICGDADTISAIAGGLAGAYYGFEHLPKRWVDLIDCKEELEKISEEIANLDKKY